MDSATGIYVRAVNDDGEFGAYDMATLAPESLTEFMRRDGGKNVFAENIVRVLLGYAQLNDE